MAQQLNTQRLRRVQRGFSPFEGREVHQAGEFGRVDEEPVSIRSAVREHVRDDAASGMVGIVAIGETTQLSTPMLHQPHERGQMPDPRPGVAGADQRNLYKPVTSRIRMDWQWPFTGILGGEILDSLLADFLIAFAFFTALSYAVLGRRFGQQRPAVVMSAALGVALALGLVWWEGP